MSSTKKNVTKKSANASSVAPTSTEMKTAIKESFSQLLTQKLNDRPFVAYTGKLGQIDFMIACQREIAVWGEVAFTLEEEEKLRAELMETLPEGCYKIGG